MTDQEKQRTTIRRIGRFSVVPCDGEDNGWVIECHGCNDQHFTDFYGEFGHIMLDHIAECEGSAEVKR